jgi:hypothetical protein
MRFVRQKVWNAILTWTLKTSAITTCHGIVLCDANFNDEDDHLFVTRTKQALDLISTNDPRRYKWVCRHIRYILNVELNSSGSYFKSIGLCKLDFGRYRFEINEMWVLHQYASTIVHEATHGRLCAMGFRYKPATRARIERICHTEQRRFLRNAAHPNWEQISGKFDESRWDFVWHASKWHRALGLMKRWKQSMQSHNK